MKAQERRVSPGLCGLLLLALLAVGAYVVPLSAQAPGEPPATAIEMALAERTCSSTHAPIDGTSAYQQCLDARLASLRNDFGRNLSRLTAANRRKLDAKCGRFMTRELREAYLDCLTDQLATLRSRTNKVAPAASDQKTAATLPSPALATGTPAPSASHARPSLLIAGAGGAGVLTAAGIGLLVLRSRRRPRRFCACGAEVSDSDLCATCRHNAAEALRSAAAQQALAERMQAVAEQRRREQEEIQREQNARSEEAARLREEQLAQEREEANRQRGLEEVDRPQQVADAPAPSPDEFDPYAVLGVSRDTSLEGIRGAYEQAKLKFDVDFIESLGDEARASLKARSNALDRAYQTLCKL